MTQPELSNGQLALLEKTLCDIMNRMDNIEEILRELKGPKEDTPSRYIPKAGLYWVYYIGKGKVRWKFGIANVYHMVDEGHPTTTLRCEIRENLPFDNGEDRYLPGNVYGFDIDDSGAKFIEEAFRDIRWGSISKPDLDTVLQNSKPNGLFLPYGL